METFWTLVLIFAVLGIAAVVLRSKTPGKRFEEMTPEELVESGWHHR